MVGLFRSRALFGTGTLVAELFILAISSFIFWLPYAIVVFTLLINYTLMKINLYCDYLPDARSSFYAEFFFEISSLVVRDNSFKIGILE